MARAKTTHARRFQLYLPEALYAQVRQLAFDRHITMSLYIVRSIQERIAHDTRFNIKEDSVRDE